LGINPAEFGCFVLFWVIQLAIIYKGVDSIRLLETVAAPFLIAIGLGLLAWAYVAAGGFHAMVDMPSAFDEGGPREGEFFSVFVPSLTAMVGFWATLSLNIPDFTRYAKSQRDQILGQAIGLPTTMTLFAFISVAVTTATTVIFADPETGALHEPVWDPTVLAGMIGGGGTVILSLLALAVATLSTNIAANVVSPANALINLSPRRFTFQMGGYITAAIGFAILPWKLIASTGGYIFTWLVGYSALLGPIVGILLADYFILRRTKLDVDALFRHKGKYTYMGGFNPAAMIAFVLGVLPKCARLPASGWRLWRRRGARLLRYHLHLCLVCGLLPLGSALPRPHEGHAWRRLLGVLT
jgi:NCS1 family nucleobase:cation symporter-1